jgi:hypothetical protein
LLIILFIIHLIVQDPAVVMLFIIAEKMAVADITAGDVTAEVKAAI